MAPLRARQLGRDIHRTRCFASDARRQARAVLAHYLELLAGAGMVRGIPSLLAMSRGAAVQVQSCRCSTPH